MNKVTRTISALSFIASCFVLNGCVTATKGDFVGKPGATSAPENISPTVLINVQIGSDTKDWIDAAFFAKAKPVLLQQLWVKKVGAEGPKRFNTCVKPSPLAGTMDEKYIIPFNSDSKTKTTDTPFIIHLEPGEYQITRLDFTSYPLSDFSRKTSIWDFDAEFDIRFTVPNVNFVSVGTLSVELSDKGVTVGDFFAAFEQDSAKKTAMLRDLDSVEINYITEIYPYLIKELKPSAR